MISKATVKKALGVSPQITTSMIEHIDKWSKMLDGNAEWCDEYVKSMKVEHGICREFADVVLSEMEVTISNDKLNKLFISCTEDLNENLQDGLALGSFCLKPLGNGKAEFATADRFIPISFTADKKPDDIVFIDIKKADTSRYYIRLERHSIKSGFLKITNHAFESSDKITYGKPVPLDVVDEWASILPDVAYPGMTQMDFGYYRNPLKNRIDDTPCGVSIFDSAIEIIKRIDIQGARLDWEFESGERAVHIQEKALKFNRNGETSISHLNKRLYRGIRGDDDLFKEFSPDFRDANIINGTESMYRQAEFIVGLAFGDLSNPQSVDKTATEIKSAKQRKYNRVKAIQNNLKYCLEDFVAGLSFYEGMYRSGYEFICIFNDSILTDEETDRQLILSEIAAGIRAPWEYRAIFLGEDEKTARINTPSSFGVMFEDEHSDLTSQNSKTSQTTEVQGKELNGAQTQSLIAIMSQFSAKQLSEGQAINLIVTAIGISREEARNILNGNME